MGKTLLIAIILFIPTLVPSTAFAQGMMGNWTSSPSSTASDDHTAREEQEGKEIWEKLQAKQLECKDLTDDNYAALGEYFMGQSIGNTERHAAMNQMMISTMGEEGEKQMHIVMGKRLSGCDPDAPMPQNMMGGGMMTMMMNAMMGSAFAPGSFGGTGGGGNSMMGTGFGNMMGGWGGFGVLGWVTMLAFWLLLILGIIVLIRYLGGVGKRSDEGKSPLDILKERYAKGEINKKKFEEMKKDLS